MANFIPNSLLNQMLGSGTRVDFDADTFKVMFIDAADDVPVVGDDFINDIASAARVPALASCPSLANKTVGSVGVGIFDADDTVFTSLTGDASEWLGLLKDTGTEATSDVCAFWDTATGLPFTPNGADATVQWASGGIIDLNGP